MQGGAEMAGMDGEESIIDRSSAFDGVLRTARNLRVEGQAKGEIHCEGTLYVDEGADVNARIDAANISVAGNLSGEITCRGRLQILPTGRVSGRLATARLVIQEGAIYEGELRMSNVGEGPAGEDNGSSVQVTAGTTAGSDQAAGAGMAATPYRMTTATTATTAGRRGGPPPRGDEGQRPESGPDGEPDGDPEDNR
jgi:cytoskeletal protein CcmA (bactofilin family)